MNLENNLFKRTYVNKTKKIIIEAQVIIDTIFISKIVDENDEIIEVLENNFFQEPYYGVLIKFYE